MKKIVIVDDDPSILDVLQIILENNGYEVVLLPSGKDLMAGNVEKPDLVILDKQLPGIDGLDLCRWLKDQNEFKDLPVIIFSASPYISPMAKTAGASDVLEKPFKVRELRDMIAKYLS